MCCGDASLLGGAFASPRVAGLVAATVVFPGLLGYSMMMVALHRVPPLTMATLQLLQAPPQLALGEERSRADCR